MREFIVKNNSWKMKVETIYTKVLIPYPVERDFHNLRSARGGEMIVVPGNKE
jgi:hypothetical protein